MKKIKVTELKIGDVFNTTGNSSHRYVVEKNDSTKYTAHITYKEIHEGGATASLNWSPQKSYEVYLHEEVKPKEKYTVDIQKEHNFYWILENDSLFCECYTVRQRDTILEALRIWDERQIPLTQQYSAFKKFLK